ncbi:unnamed protein product, partial [Mesorhabditis belari]|uniref:Uncharacterized protein n=1 Tax=Mesorhabditis belari TaxID=2138241 RepID=A0AAF3F0U5_9BILA
MVRRIYTPTRPETNTPVCRPNETSSQRQSSSFGQCNCSASQTDSSIHDFECPSFPQAELNRGKPPVFPKQNVNLRRPDGLWPNAKATDDVDQSSAEDQMEHIPESIERFLSIGDTTTALYWVDANFAMQRRNEESYVHCAEYVQNLCRVGAWERLITFSEDRLLHEIHLYFAYFYVTALCNLKLYVIAMNAKIGHLIELESVDLNFEKDTPIPLKVPALSPQMQKTWIKPLSLEEKVHLDGKVKELKLLSAFLCRLGKAFLAMENRTAALRFIWTAWLRDKYNMEAEELINRYNFAEGKKRQQQWEKFMSRRTYHSSPNDPRSLFVQAQQQFNNNNVNAAYAYTKTIIKEYGLYRPALLVHLNCAASVKDTSSLFLLGHELVDRCPNDEISWYAVAMYYFMIGNNAAAKNFMNKATMMNSAFGEAWVAFGHILSAENEHEQAMNCYLKALRLLDRHQDLFVFLAMEHCRTNNAKWAMDFLKDSHAATKAIDGNKTNPYRDHERGYVLYSQKQYNEARECFTRALKSVHPDAIEKNGRFARCQIMQIDRFWEPLIANLAHTYRKMENFAMALMLYECAIILGSAREGTNLGYAIALASCGDVDRALKHVHRVLSFNPHSAIGRQMLIKLVESPPDIKVTCLFPAGTSEDDVFDDEVEREMPARPPNPASTPMILRSALRKNIPGSQRRHEINTRSKLEVTIFDGQPTVYRLPDLGISPIIPPSSDDDTMETE